MAERRGDQGSALAPWQRTDLLCSKPQARSVTETGHSLLVSSDCGDKEGAAGVTETHCNYTLGQVSHPRHRSEVVAPGLSGSGLLKSMNVGTRAKGKKQ